MSRVIVVVVAWALALSVVLAATNTVNVTTNLASGASSVEVAWTNTLAAAPEHIIVSVMSPATNGVGSYLLFATPAIDTITTSNLTLNLSGQTDTTGYVAVVSIWE